MVEPRSARRTTDARSVFPPERKMPFFMSRDAECSPLSKEHLIEMESLMDIVLVNSRQSARDPIATVGVLSSTRKLTHLRHSCVRIDHAQVQP